MDILVTGATGRVGHFLVEQLAEMGHQVRALTRNPAKANFPAGVQVVEGDLMRPETLAAAMQGIEALHLITFGGDDYAPLQTGAEIVALAEEAGVKRITVLSGGRNSPLEAAMQAGSIAWTILIPVEFMSGTLDYAPTIRASGEVRQPYGERRTVIVHEADIAAVGAAALTEDGHGGKTYWITGQEVQTPHSMVQIIGAALGREIRFVDLTPEQAKQEWSAAGMPEAFINFMLWVYGSPPEQGYTLTQTVEQVTGHPGRTFAQWVSENIAAFR